MSHSLVIMNFSGMYQSERFYESSPFSWVDCKDLQGTNCYLDEQARVQLEKRLEAYSPKGIHFIDSGNYHYMSKLWTDKIKEPFRLVVFDHHTDMQGSLFENLLSCGCWVKDVLDHNPFLEKVILIGAEESLVSQIPDNYQGRIVCISNAELLDSRMTDELPIVHSDVPIYISIDKDVLGTKEVITNWDQGNLSFHELIEVLQRLIEQEILIGVDICGECAATLSNLCDSEELRKNDQVNGKLLNFFKKKFS